MSVISSAGSAAASFVHQLRAVPPQPAVPSASDDDDDGSATGVSSGSATGAQPKSSQAGVSATGGSVNILA